MIAFSAVSTVDGGKVCAVSSGSVHAFDGVKVFDWASDEIYTRQIALFNGLAV